MENKIETTIIGPIGFRVKGHVSIKADEQLRLTAGNPYILFQQKTHPNLFSTHLGPLHKRTINTTDGPWPKYLIFNYSYWSFMFWFSRLVA